VLWTLWQPHSVTWQVAAAALLLALVMDLTWGEPPVRWHPVVWMGRSLNWFADQFVPTSVTLEKTQSMRSFYLGSVYWIAQAATVFIVCSALVAVLAGLAAPVATVLLACLLKPMLSWRMLRDEVVAVEAALSRSLPSGRSQLSRLVSRDVSQLNAVQVRESAIETLAENLNDSVVAPIFWFVLLGLPGAAVYRFANTADAMWGYPGMRAGRYWQWAGKWAARADDALSWLPARITGLLLLVWYPKLLVRLPAEAARTTSPNSGWPMAAAALALNLRLGKPGVYVLNQAGRDAGLADIAVAINLASKTLMVFIFIAQAAIYCIARCELG
jgi:adenosylcobinamide-phosphate synthase